MSKAGRRVRIFSALEVANICGVVNQTAINWIRNGHLNAFTTPGGQYRIYAKDLAAFLDKRGMSASGEALHVMMANANWNNFLLAADQVTNDKLKAELESIFPDYAICQAYDWFEVGRRITEEKPGFIFLDTGLQGVDISRFINTAKNDPVFGRPYVFLLTESNSANQNTYGSTRADFVFAKPMDFGKLTDVIKSLEKQIKAATII